MLDKTSPVLQGILGPHLTVISSASYDGEC